MCVCVKAGVVLFVFVLFVCFLLLLFGCRGGVKSLFLLLFVFVVVLFFVFVFFCGD